MSIARSEKYRLQRSSIASSTALEDNTMTQMAVNERERHSEFGISARFLILLSISHPEHECRGKQDADDEGSDSGRSSNVG